MYMEISVLKIKEKKKKKFKKNCFKQLKMYVCICCLTQTRTVTCYEIDSSSRRGESPMTKPQLTTAIIWS